MDDISQSFSKSVSGKPSSPSTKDTVVTAGLLVSLGLSAAAGYYVLYRMMDDVANQRSSAPYINIGIEDVLNHPGLR